MNRDFEIGILAIFYDYTSVYINVTVPDGVNDKF
jgi:hypothetical protein